MKIKIFIKPFEPSFRKYFSCGWGNGYAIIPRKHPLYGYHYDDIHDLYPKLNVHGGLTFCAPVKKVKWPEIPKHITSGWIVGFDTAHFQDNSKRWTEADVLIETFKLKRKLESYTR